MPFNPSPKVADCREIARKWNVDQVIIIGLDRKKDTLAIASYGETSALCAQAKRINERIAKAIGNEDISIE